MAGQLIKRGDRLWLARVFVGRDAQGKRKYFNQTVHGTKKEADSVLRDLLSRRDRNGLRVAPKSTVDEYLDSWLETTAAPSVRPQTLDDYTCTLTRYVRPHLGTLPLAKVSPVEVRAMLVKLGEHGLGPRTIRKAHEVLRNALEAAVADGLLPTNPARGRLVQKALPKMEEKQRQTVPAEKVPPFIAAAKTERLGALFVVMLFGGLRPEEALALRWEDFRADAIHIHRVLVDRDGLPLTFGPPKTKKSGRAVVLPNVAVEALRDHKRRQAAEQLRAGEAWKGQGLIFCNEIGEPLRQDQTRTSFQRIRKGAGLPPLRIYDLRHSTASLLLELGEDLKVVSERLGHSTIVLTANVYGHISRGMQERAAAKLDQ